MVPNPKTSPILTPGAPDPLPSVECILPKESFLLILLDFMNITYGSSPLSLFGPGRLCGSGGRGRECSLPLASKLA